MTEFAPPTRRSALFLGLYALAHAGGVVSYLPLLTLLLPLKIEVIAPVERIGVLTIVSIAGAVVASLANIAFGALSDRTHARRGTRAGWIAAGLVVTLASYVVVDQATTPATLLLAIMLFQVAINVMLAPLFAMMADRVPDDQKGLAGGLLSLAQPLGWITGGAIAALGLGETGRLAFLGVVVAILVAPLLFLPETRGRGVAASAPADGDDAPPPAFRPADLDFLWGARLAIQTATGMLFTYLLFYFESVAAGVDPLIVAGRIGHLTGALFFVSVPVALAIGRWSDRAGTRKPFLLIAAIATAAGALAMALTEGWAAAILGYALVTCGSAVFLGLQSALAMQVLPSVENRGRDLGLLNLANTIPSVAAPALAWTLASDGAFGMTLLAVAGLAALAGLLVLPVTGHARASAPAASVL